MQRVAGEGVERGVFDPSPRGAGEEEEAIEEGDRAVVLFRDGEHVLVALVVLRGGVEQELRKAVDGVHVVAQLVGQSCRDGAQGGEAILAPQTRGGVSFDGLVDDGDHRPLRCVPLKERGDVEDQGAVVDPARIAPRAVGDLLKGAGLAPAHELYLTGSAFGDGEGNGFF